MAKGVYNKYFRGVSMLVVAVVGLGIATWGVARIKTNNKIQAQFQVGDTWVVGNFGNRGITRTSFAVNESGGIGSAARMSSGFYDKTSNTTVLIYPGGVLTANPDVTAQNAYITMYNHTTKKWEPAVKVIDTTSSPHPGDGHLYPQAVVDKLGYIHVFQTFHNGTGIAYYRSAKKIYEPGVLNSFVEQKILGSNGLPLCGINNNTYGVSFVDNQGEIYLFFRTTEYDNVNGTYPGVVKEGSDKTKWRFYAPEVFIKSSNNGLTWTDPRRVIDPGLPSIFNNVPVPDIAGCNRVWNSDNVTINDTGYTSVYAWEFEPDVTRNGLHIGYSITLNKEIDLNQYYYAYFDFNTDHVFTPTKKDLGEWADTKEYDDPANKMMIMSQKTPLNFTKMGGNAVSMAIASQDPANAETVYYTFPADAAAPTTLSYLWKAVWNGSDWTRTNMSTAYPSLFEDLPEVNDAEYRPGMGTDLIVRHKSKYNDNRPYDMYQKCLGTSVHEYKCNSGDATTTDALNFQKLYAIHNSQNNWKAVRVFAANEINQTTGATQDNRWWGVNGASWFQKIYNANPEMRAFMMVPKFTCDYYIAHQNDKCTDALYSNRSNGALYVIGDKTISPSPTVTVVSTPTPQSLSCTSWTNISMNGCNSATKYGANDPICTTTISTMPVDNNVVGANPANTLMRYLKVAPEIVCANITWPDESILPYVPYSTKFSDGIFLTSGGNKVCAQFKNSINTVVCGSIIKK